MGDNKNSSNTPPPAPNPAKTVTTPQIPTKSTRDDGYKVINHPSRGEKK